ncbi:MAG: hypothetical protein Q9222_004037 [Ikaeria aurantiellina]
MCIHHITYHAACGHTTQASKNILKCNPVVAALKFYENQRAEFEKEHRGRVLTLTPMKMPQRCGADLVHPMRTIIFVGFPHSLTPKGWHVKMTECVEALLKNGEDTQSIIILLETQYPHMLNQISEQWIHHLRECFQNSMLQWRPDEDLHNDHLGGDVVMQIDQRGCSRVTTEDPRCAKGWRNPYGGTAYCPVLRAQELGVPMSLQICSGNSSPLEEGQMEDFAVIHDRELRRQAMEHWNLLQQGTGCTIDARYQGHTTTAASGCPHTANPADQHVNPLPEIRFFSHSQQPPRVELSTPTGGTGGPRQNTQTPITIANEPAQQNNDTLAPHKPSKGKAHSVAVMETCRSVACMCCEERRQLIV